jgi:hypothetical protein
VYLGVDVHRAARICAAGHGGQVLLSQSTRDLVEDRFQCRDLGGYSLAGLVEPERIFQLAAAGLRSQFPPLRAVRADNRRLGGLVPRRHARQSSFTEAAWHLQRLLGKVEVSLQPPLQELGAALFTADRALLGADGFLARIDRVRLARRLAAQVQIAVHLPPAREETEQLRTRIACVEHLDDRRQALASHAPGLIGKLDALRTEREVILLRDPLAAATGELDHALAIAARALDPLSFKLQRTRYRGVYCNGSRYIVPYIDEHGRDRSRDFDTIGQAHNFERALRTVHDAPRETSRKSLG